MNTLLAILNVIDTRRDVILAGGLYHRFPWRHLPPPPTPLGGSESVSCHVRRKVYATGLKRPNKKLEKGTEQYLHHNTMVKENNSVHNVNSKEQDSAQTKEKKTLTG